MTTTSGSCAWIVYDPFSSPSVPGRLSELRPRQSPHPDNTNAHAAVSAAASTRLTVDHREPSALEGPGSDRSVSRSAAAREATTLPRAGVCPAAAERWPAAEAAGWDSA